MPYSNCIRVRECFPVHWAPERWVPMMCILLETRRMLFVALLKEVFTHSAVTRAPTNCDIIGNTATHQASLYAATVEPRGKGTTDICPSFRFVLYSGLMILSYHGQAMCPLLRRPVWHIITVVDNEKDPFIECRPCTHVFESSTIHRGYIIKTENRVSCIPDSIWR